MLAPVLVVSGPQLIADPGTERGRSMERPALVPELYVSSLERSLEFYLGAVGFEVAYDRPEERFACLCLDAAYLMLEETPSLARATSEQFAAGQWRTADLESPFGRGMNLEIRVGNLQEIELRLRSAGHELLLDAHERTYRVGMAPYRVRQLLVADPDGYLLRFSEPMSIEKHAGSMSAP